MEVDLKIAYDPQVLEIEEKNITITSVFRTISVEKIEAGEISFTLFIIPAVGYQPVKLDQETKIATLNFSAVALEQTPTQVDLEFDEDSASVSSLIAFNTKAEDPLKNILKQTIGVKFLLVP